MVLCCCCFYSFMQSQNLPVKPPELGIWFSERSYLVKKLRGDFNFLNLSLSLSPSLSVRWCTDWEWIDSLEFSANVEVVFCQTTLWQSRRSLLWWELEACSIHWLLQVNRHVVIWRLLLPEHDNLVKKKKAYRLLTWQRERSVEQNYRKIT